MVGASKACRARTDDRDLLFMLLVGVGLEFQALLNTVIPDESLHCVDRHSPVHVLAVALVLAGVGTDATADGGQWIMVGENVERLLEGLVRGLAVILVLCDRLQPSADIRALGTPDPARGRLFDVSRPEAGFLAAWGTAARSRMNLQLFFWFLQLHRSTSPARPAPVRVSS